MTTYLQAHSNVVLVRGRADGYDCASCGNPATEWAYDHSCPNELVGEGRYAFSYSTDVSTYQPMCRSCHRKFDYSENEQNRASKAAQLAQARETPAFKEATSAAMTRLNSIRRRCTTCGYVSLPGGLGKHIKDLNHEGWEPV